MRYATLLFLLASAFLTSCGGSATTSDDPNDRSAFREIAKSVRKPLEASNAAIERTKVALASASGKGDPALLTSLAEAQKAVQEVIQQQESVVQQFELVISLGQQIQKEKDALL